VKARLDIPGKLRRAKEGTKKTFVGLYQIIPILVGPCRFLLFAGGGISICRSVVRLKQFARAHMEDLVLSSFVDKFYRRKLQINELTIETANRII
jgi:hypothetical protein